MLLAGSMRSVRVPPVHELERDDIPHLRRTLAHASVLLSQPIRPDYRELPLGTAQVTAVLPPGAQTVLFPVMRYAGLFPFQAIVRSPVRRPTRGAVPRPAHPRAERHRHRAGPRRHRVGLPRGRRAVAGGAAVPRTAPRGRPGLRPGATRRRGRRAHHQPPRQHGPARAGRTRPRAPGAGGRRAATRAARCSTRCTPRWRQTCWTPSGSTPSRASTGCWPASPCPTTVVRDAQLHWYAAHPEVAAAGLERHAGTLRLLALA